MSNNVSAQTPKSSKPKDAAKAFEKSHLEAIVANAPAHSKAMVTGAYHGLDDVRIHDLRHTYASILVSSGASLLMIGALLGHPQPQTTQRYAHLHDHPLRELSERVGKVVAPPVSESEPAKVVPLRGEVN
jgi:site-specific recombinase XerD